MSMRYRRRKIWLILLWIFLFIIVSFATLYYGYARSVDAATDTIRTSLQKVDGSIEDLISDEIKIRNSYEQTHASMGEMVPFLQEHDLEKTVPDRDHLETYQDLLEANYIAVIDPEGKTAVSSGKLVPDKHNVEISTEEGLLAWMTSAHVLVPAEEDYTTVEIPLKDDYTLRYQISNEEANIVQNEVFSWRVVLRDMTLPNEAYFVVISKKDDTILVHPDKDKIGASYDAIGFKSKKDFLNTYVKPDNDGISYQKDMSSLLLKGKKPRDLLYSELNLTDLQHAGGHVCFLRFATARRADHLYAGFSSGAVLYPVPFPLAETAGDGSAGEGGRRGFSHRKPVWIFLRPGLEPAADCLLHYRSGCKCLAGGASGASQQ